MDSLDDRAELKSLLSDKMWRLNNLYKIVDKDGRQVTFKMNRAQLDFFENQTGRDLILKARQLGFTTMAQIVGLDEAIFNNDWSAVTIAHTLTDAMKIFAKVTYALKHLPQWLKDEIVITKHTERMVVFENGSSLEVANSGRSGTYQRVHVSEFGKICAWFPKKAREIVTGTIPAAGDNPFTIESTAEGQDGYFYSMCMEAMSADSLKLDDWKLHFYPWMEEDRYQRRPDGVIISKEDHQYFDELQTETAIEINLNQRAWWVRMERTLGADMKREFPATPKEAFEQAIEGAYFKQQMHTAEKKGQIGHFPIVPHVPVNTFWDLGRNDFNTLWFHQYYRGRHRFINYYENSGEFIGHYIQHLKEFRDRHQISYGDHFWPHDGDRDDLFLKNGRLGMVREEYGFTPRVVERVHRKIAGIEAARKILPLCDFDAENCAKGISHMKLYRKQFDEKNEVFKDNPVHNDSSHGADGFMTFATGWTDPETHHKGPPTVEEVLARDLPMQMADRFQEDYDSQQGGDVLDYWK